MPGSAGTLPMPSAASLLGFAFANADFLFEVDAAGTILFAAGAANDLVATPGEALVGKPAWDALAERYATGGA